MCMCQMYMYTHNTCMQSLQRPEEGVKSPGTEVIVDYKLLSVCAGIQIQVLWKSIECS